MRVEACGVCHSDLHVVETDGLGHARFPILLGHEGAGVVEEVGPDVTIGRARRPRRDRVARAVRRQCPACLRGDPRRCSNNLRATRRMHRASDGALLTPVLRCGTFADRVIVHEACAVKVPEELPVEQACLLACGFSTGAGAALWATPVREGASVAVIGCGGVGLAVVQGARLARRRAHRRGRRRRREARASRGRSERPTSSTRRGADAVDAGARADRRRGVDFAFSAIGARPGLVDAVRMCGYAGTATLVGVPAARTQLDVDLERTSSGRRSRSP